MSQLNFSAPLMLRAPVGSALPSKIEGIAYSGAAVPGYGVVIDLAQTAFNTPMQLLLEHDRAQPVGVIEGAAVGGGQLVIVGRLFSDIAGGSAERIAMNAQRGSPYQLSIGLFGFSETQLSQGQSTTVNGRAVVGPITILRGGLVREVSVVTLGADRGASARFLSGAHKVTDLSARLSPACIFSERRRHAAGIAGIALEVEDVVGEGSAAAALVLAAQQQGTAAAASSDQPGLPDAARIFDARRKAAEKALAAGALYRRLIDHNTTT